MIINRIKIFAALMMLALAGNAEQPGRPVIAPNTGLYRLAESTGILTGVAAGTATAGHVFAWRWTTNTTAVKECLVKRIRIRCQTLTAFTAAQELQFKIFKVTGFTANYSGGTAITVMPRRYTQHAASIMNAQGDMRIGTTGALTAGTQTLDTEPIGILELWSQNGAAPAVNGGEVLIEGDYDTDYIVRLQNNEGLVIRNEILMGAAGTCRLTVEFDWQEVNP